MKYRIKYENSTFSSVIMIYFFFRVVYEQLLLEMTQHGHEKL
jgi:hypothetical protein